MSDLREAASVISEDFADFYVDAMVDALLEGEVDEEVLQQAIKDGLEPWDIYRVEIALFGEPLDRRLLNVRL